MKNTKKNFMLIVERKKLVCFGAGKYFRKAKAFLDAEGIVVDCLIDNDKKKWGTEIDGLIVKPPTDIARYSKGTFVVYVTTKNYAKEIQNQLRSDMKVKEPIFQYPLEYVEKVEFDDKIWKERIYKPCENLYKEIAPRVNEKTKCETYLEQKLETLNNREKLILPRTPLMITTRCTLNCKECSNLIPHYVVQQDYPVLQIMEWIKNILDAVDEWICCEFVGGEPFLYKDLQKLLKFALDQSQIQQIEFTTNGTIIPNDEILELLENHKVFVKISEYPKLVNNEKVLTAFKDHNICFEVLKDMKWVKTGSLKKRGRSRIELQNQYLNCTPSVLCRTILNGKIYVCSKAASLTELGKAVDIEYVDLLNKEDLRNELKKFMQLTNSNACNYCDMGSMEEEIIEAAIQTDKKEVQGI